MTKDCRQISVSGIRSLSWFGDDLVDWVGGGRTIRADGTIEAPSINYGYKFDAVETSPCGEFAVIYEKRGTKGLVLSRGKVLREINRSFYCADAYEYPIAIFRAHSGRIILAHCPEEYCRIEFEDIETGEPYGKSSKREPADFFHSRLSVSPNGRWLLSAGWVWHPWDCLAFFDIEEGLQDSKNLDCSAPTPDIDGEVSSAEFMPDNRIVLATGVESLDGGEANAGTIGPSSLAVFDPTDLNLSFCNKVVEPIGNLMSISERTAVGFYGHPKLYSLETGEVLQEWKEIRSGNQVSSIIGDHTVTPPIACDPENGRFAVASESTLFVVTVST